MRLLTALRAFFAALFNRSAAQRIALALDQAPPGRPTPIELSESDDYSEQETMRIPPRSAPIPTVAQSESITLLAALQREARFVDFVREPLSEYSDAQIGAAARSVHSGCEKVLQRFFALEPLFSEAEGSPVEITDENQSLCQLSGNLSKKPPIKGKLMHSGWKATKIELPIWSGSAETARLIAPAEIEIE